jgi:ABC-type arginine transport system ATPase subunit
MSEQLENVVEQPTEIKIDWYEFDFSKVNTIEDIKLILQAMGMKFNQLAPNFEELVKYGKKVD